MGCRSHTSRQHPNGGRSFGPMDSAPGLTKRNRPRRNSTRGPAGSRPSRNGSTWSCHHPCSVRLAGRSITTRVARHLRISSLVDPCAEIRVRRVAPDSPMPWELECVVVDRVEARALRVARGGCSVEIERPEPRLHLGEELGVGAPVVDSVESATFADLLRVVPTLEAEQGHRTVFAAGSFSPRATAASCCSFSPASPYRSSASRLNSS